MFNKISFFLSLFLLVMFSQNALATKWVDHFENDLRKGLLEEAIQKALNQDVAKDDIITALEAALEKGIVPEEKAAEAEELLVSDLNSCPRVCGPSPVFRCGILAELACCECCTPLPFYCK